MPLYEYECPKGHRSERIAAVTTPGEPLDKVPCPTCAKRKKAIDAELVPSQTGKPKFKRGIGGFYSPTQA
jgi:hypothetical protein